MRIFRWIHLAITLGVLAVVGAASLSDSVQGAPGTILSIGAAIAARIVPGTGLGVGGGGGLPFATDTISHFIAWTAVGVVASGLVKGFAERMNLFLGLFALSALIEAGQRYLSWSRSAELTDLIANGIGLAVGFIGFWMLGRTVRALAPDVGLRAEDLVRNRLRWL